ncbi:uncharacterized protein LOC119449075 [Dermacentor silvarum]|uniref:uncharacterized protein LOC119449075 n=1 Tax=Dermacentor silvarum TaxID=543639 RepID=UPI00189BFDBC|nr:uncharacterized protein LOC119449075 [Dermacentor silvarum]
MRQRSFAPLAFTVQHAVALPYISLLSDAGYYDEDGRLYIVERLKQLIKCMDNQVAPMELEELLLREHSADIAEVSVVGLPHSDYGEAPAAAIVLTQEGRAKNPELLATSIKATVESECVTMNKVRCVS